MIKKTKKYNRGEMSFGLEILLFIVAIFIIWVLMGGAKKEKQNSMFMLTEQGQVTPSGIYGQ